MKRIYARILYSIFVWSLLSLSIGKSATSHIPFELVNGLIVVKAEIDGRSGNFVLDTGASDLLINERVTSGDESFTTCQGEVTGESYKVQAFKIGSIEKQKLTAYKVNLENIASFLNIELLGILGGETFAPDILEIDFSRKIIVVAEVDLTATTLTDYTAVNYDIVQGVPVVSLEINGVAHNFILDSGATSHFIDDSIPQNEPHFSSTGSTSNVVLTGSESSGNQQWLFEGTLGLNDLKMSQVHFLTLDMESYTETLDIPVSGLLSMRALSDYIIIDLKSNFIYLR